MQHFQPVILEDEKQWFDYLTLTIVSLASRYSKIFVLTPLCYVWYLRVRLADVCYVCLVRICHVRSVVYCSSGVYSYHYLWCLPNSK